MHPKLALLLVVSVAGSGCSLASVYGPAPSTKPRIDVSCTDERYAPAIDLGTTALLISDAIATNSKDVRGLALVGALGYGASTVYGYLTTRDCMDAKNAAYRYHTRMLQKQYDVLDEFTAQGAPSEPVPAPPPATPPPATPDAAPLTAPPATPPTLPAAPATPPSQ